MYASADPAAAGGAAAGGDAAAAGGAAAGGAAAGGAAGALLKEGWLRVSFKDLLENKRYPGIPYGKDKFSRIKLVDGMEKVEKGEIEEQQMGYFRKNNKFAQGGEIPAVDAFYFRLSGKNLYYTETKADMIVLGAISINNTVGTDESELGKACFKVKNSEDDQWELCPTNSTDVQTKQDWVCAIQNAFGLECNPVGATGVIIEEKIKNKQPIMIVPLPSLYCNQNWNYENLGADWNCKCAEGYFQSPVELKRGCAQQIKVPVEFTFNRVTPARMELVYRENMMRLICKGDETDCLDFSLGSLVDYNMTNYVGKEIRFHTPGEHTIDDDTFDMEIQVIFEPVTEGDYRKKAILSFVVKEKAGATNKFLKYFDYLHLPNMMQEQFPFPGAKDDPDFAVSVEELFMNDQEDSFPGYFNYYYYQGSDSAPPCQEEVRWFVVSEPIHVGLTELAMIKDVLQPPKLSLDGGSSNVINTLVNHNSNGNYRMKQDLNHRAVYYFDTENAECMPKIKKPEHQEGHYERVERSAYTYIYVPNNEPSGIENAFVVSQKEAKGIVANRTAEQSQEPNMFG